MKRFPITNAVIFKAELPSAEVLSEHLKELPFVDILESHYFSNGFIPNRITGELVTPIEGGFIIQFRIDEKILPASAVAFEVNKRITKLQDQGVEGYSVMDIKNGVLAELLKIALTKTKVITALYHVEKGFLIVSTTNKSDSQSLVGGLVKACGSVKTETIHVDDVKKGITTRLINYIEERSANDCFGYHLFPGNFYLLQRKADKKPESIKYDAEFDYIKEELTETLSNNFKVNLMELSTRDIKFKLNENFQFKSIKPIHDIECEGDAAYRYRHINAVFMLHITNTVCLLIELLKYKEKTK